MRRPPSLHILLLVGVCSLLGAVGVLLRWTPPHFDVHLPALGAVGVLLRWTPPHFDVHLPAAGGSEHGVGLLPHYQHAGAISAALTTTTPPFPVEVWAGGYSPFTNADLIAQTRALLSENEQTQLAALCGRCLYHTLTNVVEGHQLGYWTFVATGDIPEMWLRDSAVQLGVYFSRIPTRPSLRRLIEGAVRTAAFFITQDPYANAFNAEWKYPDSLDKFERLLGRGGWVGTRNYELDSGAYFINLLYNYWAAESISRRAADALLNDPLIQDAVELMVDTWIVEQRHEELSPYRYSELRRDGVGAETGYTGMTWCGFRPSDDPNTYGYSIPSNMYAAGALRRVLAMNSAVWRDSNLAAKTSKLLQEIGEGINKYGVLEVEPGVYMYAYEVDGLGNHLADFDDANVPSLLAAPLLGWDGLNMTIYETTRSRLLNKNTNKWYFESEQLRGIGSPHTGRGRVWPLALSVQALTSKDPSERAQILQMMLRAQCGNGLMHESVNVNNLNDCTRPIFEWANAMLVTLTEASLGFDCEQEAERYRLQQVMAREEEDTSRHATNGAKDNALYYELLESLIPFDKKTRGSASSFHHYKVKPKSPPPSPPSPPPPVVVQEVERVEEQ